jgi:hypothetical protein
VIVPHFEVMSSCFAGETEKRGLHTLSWQGSSDCPSDKVNTFLVDSGGLRLPRGLCSGSQCLLPNGGAKPPLAEAMSDR